MMSLTRRKGILLALAVCAVFLFMNSRPFYQAAFEPTTIKRPENEKQTQQQSPQPPHAAPSPPPVTNNGRFSWAKVKQRYPAHPMAELPQGNPKSLPVIQHRFPAEAEGAKIIRTARLEAVRGNFSHAWAGYKQHAWMNDEVGPISGKASNHFGGWAATLVDSLDTLWLMGLQYEFEEAVKSVEKIDFTDCSLKEVNVFETTIRFLGGLLGAYDISDGKYPALLKKATEVGQMLYAAFDTPNRMPVTRWKLNDAMKAVPQEAGDNVLVAEIGSLTLEFTRLSQLTKDPRYYDAVHRIMAVFDQQQNETKVPGLWPTVVNAKTLNFRGSSGFTLGGMADSLYEYLPKQYVLLGGSEQYHKLYHDALVAINSSILFRPMTQDGESVLFTGDVLSDEETPVSELKPTPRVQHLGCFAGGMVGLGARAFGNDGDMDIARKLTEGCLWAYEKSNMGFMPEIMHTVRCDDREHCPWDEKKWKDEVDKIFETEGGSAKDKIQRHHLPPGTTKVDDGRYILRPEAIESIFILYRLTGDSSLPDRAWRMFTNTIQHTVTDIAHAGLNDCTVPDLPKSDRMESFWLAETLKYFYLMFSEPEVLSLDEFVLNTEAHPLRWR